MECAASLDVMKLRKVISDPATNAEASASKAWSRC